MNYICLNGEIFPEKHAHLSLSNRAFHFGEGIVEEMRTSGIRVPFFSLHFDRLTRALNLLGIAYISAFTEDSLLRAVELLIHRKKLYMINKVRITMWREDDDNLLSGANNVQYLIEAEPLDEREFRLNDHGLYADVLPVFYKEKSFLSAYKTTNRLFAIQALKFAKAHKMGAIMITDPAGNIVEEATSNIFFANGQTIYTPSLESNCTDGIMRKVILDMAEQKGLIVIESDTLTDSFVFEVEEVFLTDDVYGIRWVAGFKEKRFRRKRSVEFVSELNRMFEKE